MRLGPNSILCPVAALKAYLSLVPAPLSAPLFMVPVANSAKPLLAAHFNRFLKACASATGFDPNHFSSRSFRQGGATFVFNCGAPTEFIKAQGDWQSDAYLIYLKLSTQKKLDILRSISSRLSHIRLWVTVSIFFFSPYFFFLFISMGLGYYLLSPVFNKHCFAPNISRLLLCGN